MAGLPSAVPHWQVLPASRMPRIKRSRVKFFLVVLTVLTVLGIILYSFVIPPLSRLLVADVQCRDIGDNYAYVDIGLWNSELRDSFARWEIYVDGKYSGGDNSAYGGLEFRRYHLNLTALSEKYSPDSVIRHCAGHTVTVRTFSGDQYVD